MVSFSYVQETEGAGLLNKLKKPTHGRIEEGRVNTIN